MSEDTGPVAAIEQATQIISDLLSSALLASYRKGDAIALLKQGRTDQLLSWERDAVAWLIAHRAGSMNLWTHSALEKVISCHAPTDAG